MIYKRATKQLRSAGIKHIEIHKYLWGPCPIDPRLIKQTSECFKTPQEAAQAVIDGFRPTDESASCK